MALIVEDGTGLANAESYVSVADATAYAGKMGLAWSSDATVTEPALRRATRWIDNAYRGRFNGQRRLFRLQALEWPRIGAFVRMPLANTYDFPYSATGRDFLWSGYVNVPLPYNTVPQEIVTATIEAAIREVAEPNSLLPDVSQQQSLKRAKVGATEAEFFTTLRAPPGSTGFPAIDAILASLLGPQSGYTARASRG